MLQPPSSRLRLLMFQTRATQHSRSVATCSTMVTAGHYHAPLQHVAIVAFERPTGIGLLANLDRVGRSAPASCRGRHSRLHLLQRKPATSSDHHAFAARRRKARGDGIPSTRASRASVLRPPCGGTRMVIRHCRRPRDRLACPSNPPSSDRSRNRTPVMTGTQRQAPWRSTHHRRCPGVRLFHHGRVWRARFPAAQ